jgi:hypothetical protein
MNKNLARLVIHNKKEKQKMGKNYNIRLIKHRESYSLKQISEMFNVHQRTVQEWKKEGLKTISSEKPFLVMGYDLKEFLKEKLKTRKTKLDANQFYCTRCRKAVTSKDNSVSVNKLSKTIGKYGFNCIAVRGHCQICGAKLNKFSHFGKITELKNIFNITNIGGFADE